MVYIGIDIAKRSHVLSAVDDDGKAVIESFKFANTDRGFEKLLDPRKTSRNCTRTCHARAVLCIES